MAEQIPVKNPDSMQLVHRDEPPLHSQSPTYSSGDDEAPRSPLTNQPVPNILCADCKQNMYLLGEATYVVHDQLWESAFPGDDRDCLGPLCVGCLEARLTRPLELGDFTNAYGNFIEISEWHRSARLLDRLSANSPAYEERRVGRLGRDCPHAPYEPRAVHRFCIHDDALLLRLSLLRSKI